MIGQAGFCQHFKFFIGVPQSEKGCETLVKRIECLTSLMEGKYFSPKKAGKGWDPISKKNTLSTLLK